MGNGNIQDAVKFLTGIWRDAGKNVSAEETRKWIQPHVETVSRIMADKDAAATLGKIVADVFPDGNWQSAVALNQILFLGRLNERPEKAKDILAKFYEVWNKQPLNLSAFLVEWRKQTVGSNLDPEIILNTIEYDASKQSYFDPDLSKTGADFFTNMYKEELGVDINALADAAARIVGEEHVEDFFRLVDIDAPMAPEEFVKRVEKAIDVLAAA
ncbi:MAG: hypothetical protein PWP76_211, partial [Candidatus Diapherotrites archaeon]|nr:hypothetical protein [Candidatus Diapherotrites archaeon]MDN5367259.1 hypothetical protein [Candidatus Diapherotrites archaeon]